MSSTKSFLKYVNSLERLGIKKGLSRIEALTGILGNPQNSYPCVHVAGTNGKGSTCAMIASILTQAGYRVGLYTSPHLEKFNERIAISGRHITDSELAKYAAAVKKAVGVMLRGPGKRAGQINERSGGDLIDELAGVVSIGERSGADLIDEPSFFEFTTALAFLYFKEKKVDIAVFEAGMGGKWDATNVVTPLVSGITNIGLDHTAILGRSLRAIAGEKAGIIKPGVPVVTGEGKAAALAVIKAAAKKNKAKLYKANADFSSRRTDTSTMTFDYHGIEKDYKGLNLSLFGDHQFANAATALGTLEMLSVSGFKAGRSAIAKGLISTAWPARFEVVSRKPDVIIDSAHNPAGALVLKKAIIEKKRGTLVLVLGIMHDKDVAGIVKILAPVADIIIATQANTERAEGADKLMRVILKRAKVKTILAEGTIPGACKIALRLVGPDDTICVAGSIYTAAEARRYFLKKKGRA